MYCLKGSTWEDEKVLEMDGGDAVQPHESI